MLRIQVMKNLRVIQLAGRSRRSNIYIKGIENLTSNTNNESMILTEIDSNTTNSGDLNNADAQIKTNDVENFPIPVAIPILVTLYSISSSKSIGEYSVAEKIITIGCNKVNKQSDKKDTKKVI